MPLFELYQMAKGKVASSEDKKSSSSADLSFIPDNDLVELVWENGQVLMQGQSSRVKKFPPSNGLSSHPPKTRDKDVGNETNTIAGRIGTANSVLNEMPISMPSNEMGLSQDDEMVPWLNYPMDQSLQHDYYSDFLPEISGVTVHEPSTHNNLPSFDRRSGGNPSIRGSDSAHKVSSFEHRIMSNFSEPEDGEATRGRGSDSQLYSLSYQHDKSKFMDRISDRMSHASIRQAACGDSVGPSTPSLTSSSSGLMNFSHFLRPATLVKASLQNVGSTTNAERVESYGKGSVANGGNPSEFMLMKSNGGLCKEKLSQSQPTTVPLKGDVRGSENRPLYEPLTVEPPAPAVCQDDVLMNDRSPCQFAGESSTRGPSDGEKTVDPIVASSSVCSGSSADRVSDDPPHNLKRKHRYNEESECPSEDAEDESVSVKKATSTRPCAGSKRSRAAEVHNLSERRRRDRINEKMRALQELIPNCNKVDKASMLDEAIEYLKTLQLQVQIMSMGSGMYMPQMMLPPGMQHMHAAAAHMAHFSPMGVGMGMGMAMGYGMGLPDMNGGSACSPMHGAPFAGLYMSGNSAMPGMAGSNLPLYGYPGQGHPMSVPHTPMVPMSGGPPMKSATGQNPSGTVGPLDNMNSSMASSSKVPMQQQHMAQAIQNPGACSSMNQTPSQCQATNRSVEQPGTAQDNRAGGSTHGNEKVPDR